MSATNLQPFVSVVIETITARYTAGSASSLPDDLAPTLDAVARQTLPADRREVLIVVDPLVSDLVSSELARRHPEVRLVEADTANYCEAKNTGAAAAAGEVVAFTDGDCRPEPDWLARAVARLAEGADAVAGRTRYPGRSPHAQALAFMSFGHVRDRGGRSTGFVLNNVVLSKDALMAHPLDPRVIRNGGCTLLHHQLVEAGRTVVYEPGARVVHSDADVRGWRALRKHLERGRDSAALYRLDTAGVLRGTAWWRRLGPLVFPALIARRIGTDWTCLLREHEQVGIGRRQVPYVAAVTAFLRCVELVGMLVGSARHAAAERVSRSGARPPRPGEGS